MTRVALGRRWWEVEGGEGLTFIPQGLGEDLVAQGLVVGEVLGRGMLADLARSVRCVAPHSVQVGHSHGLFDSCDVNRGHWVGGRDATR